MTEFFRVIDNHIHTHGFEVGTLLVRVGDDNSDYTPVECGPQAWRQDFAPSIRNGPHDPSICQHHNQHMRWDQVEQVDLVVTPEKVEKYLSGEDSLW